MTANEMFDVCVIGAGIAGASVAAELAATRKVLLLERESQPGYHTTGRSAALFSTTYGPPVIRALSRASQAFYRNPPKGFERPLLTPRGALMIARPDQLTSLEALASELDGVGERMDGDRARALFPLLRNGHIAAAILEREAQDIDVHALHHGYLRQFKERGGIFVSRAELTALDRTAQGWTVRYGEGRCEANIVVNAGGAWADVIAGLAGVAPARLTPKRRTAAIVALPDGIDGQNWPMIIDIDEQFYAKPDAGRLLISPADETPSEPSDAQPDEYDIAVAVDRIETALDLQIRHIASKWAGLRTFAPDKNPVVGWAETNTPFFWLAGQGGYGIQTAPALAKVAAALILDVPLDDNLAAQGIDLGSIAPTRQSLK